ncbi:MAG: glycosyltransferase family 2 protein [Bacteroidota bacterium]
MQLSIIIVNYNVKFFLEQCLCSVVKACKNIDVEIFVVDNNSTDGSKDFFNNRFPQVQFIWKNTNVGFAKANNEALKQAKGEKILFLNPDTILPEDGIEKCLQFFNQQNNIGSLGVKMIEGAGNFLPESKRGFPSFFTSFCKMTGLTILFPTSKIFARYYLGHLPENKTSEVDVLSGAFMMVDKKVLDTVGSFDEDYFMYAEDIDLSYRIQKAGYKNFYFADTAIIHFKGESTTKQSTEYLNNFYGTMVLFVKKHYQKLSGGLYILLLKVLIAAKKLFASKEQATQNKILPPKAYMIADEETFKREKLQKHFSQVKQAEKISTAEKGSAVIFCEPYVSFAEIISSMQENKNQYSFFIHADSSNSIVGSGDKNQPGVAIALHQ